MPGPFDPRLDSFRSDPFQMGVDLRRSIITTDPGVYVADPAATFRQGMALAQNAAGNIVRADQTGPAPTNKLFGIAKANKVNALVGSYTDQPLVLTGIVASNLKKAPVFGGVGFILVRSAPVNGTVYTEGVDYVVNYTNGTITRVGAGIPSGSTVYVSYTYQLLEADLDFQGRNFFNFLDDVSIQDGRVTIIQAWAQLFLTTYDPSVQYAVGDNLYLGAGTKAGLFTNVAAGAVVASVMQVPTASDPFLGMKGVLLATQGP